MAEPHPLAHQALAAFDQSRIWSQLPAELTERVFSFLPANDVPCTVRLLNKAAAAQFRGPLHTTIHLSLPVPHHAFLRQYGNASAMRGLTVGQRQRLVCLTARSGSVPNLKVAAAKTGCLLTDEVMEHAASAGKLDVCRWLLQMECPYGSPLKAAAEAGQLDACRWCLSNGYNWTVDAVAAAGRGGHIAVVDFLMKRCPFKQAVSAVYLTESEEEDQEVFKNWERLEAAARGADLATLQRVRAESLGWLDTEGDPNGSIKHRMTQMLTAIACSRTPDWQAKVEWLEEVHGVLRNGSTCPQVADKCEDALDRLRWLHKKCFVLDARVGDNAAARGRCDVLVYLLEEIPPAPEQHWDLEDWVWSAAQAGHLDVLVLLHDKYGAVLDGSTLRGAVEGGHVHVARWLIEVQGVPVPRDLLLTCGEVAAQVGGQQMLALLHEHGCELSEYTWLAAVRTGSMQTLHWLHERGCPWHQKSFQHAAARGTEEALEWLVEQGCPLPESGYPYRLAAGNADMATLRCLRRLGCPSGGDEGWLFVRCMEDCCRIEVLSWLAAAGCPVDWKLTVDAVVKLRLPEPGVTPSHRRSGIAVKEVWNWIQLCSEGWWWDAGFRSAKEAMDYAYREYSQEVQEWYNCI
ncbi:hypothetical protein Agub_g5921 [Astrephomene gubernaculifera]|uniref:Ankyrin repeat domain-containing protein n=1 Tax=Astrephomene gubernaculifera TaxID=47775 RepID=A0AAD3DQ29_9CHLO|nr:hypothetical protein Agub_g5921 [Astrephomene gubernaculifera]